MHAYVRACMRACVRACVYEHVCELVSESVCMCKRACVHAYVHACMHMCMRVYIEIFVGTIFRGLAPKPQNEIFANPTGLHVVECCHTRLLSWKRILLIALLEASTCMETCWSPV